MELFRLYTGGVVRKQTAGRHELAELLPRLRDEVRMSRGQLARAGGLSVGPIKRIETEGHIPKAPTLKQIAEGLATYAPGRRDEDLVNDYYDRLMRAAGYLVGDGSAVDNSTAENDEAVIQRNLEARYGEDVGFVVAVLDKLATQPPTRRKTILDLLLYGIGDAMGRPSMPREAQLSR